MEVFSGKKEADRILNYLRENIKRKPVLAIIYVGNNPESKLYIAKKREAAKKVGVIVFCYRFEESDKEDKILDKIGKLNRYPSVDGIIVQLPLPDRFDTGKIINAIDPRKDVDGFHKKNRELLKKGKPYFWPVLPLAILFPLKKFKGKKIIALVNSDIFGETIKDFFTQKKIDIDYFTKGKEPDLKLADVIISVRGEPEFIKGEMVKEGVAIIDAGIKLVEGHLKGDIDIGSLDSKASFVTPVPGGIGPLTVALLLKNVYLASKSK